MQLCLILRENIYWEGFRQLYRYYPETDPVEAPTIVDNITSLDDAAVLLISGKIIHTCEEALFGAFIPVPSKDGYEIQEQHGHWPELFSCLLLELSPVHDVSWGNISRPGWSVTSDELCFGEKDNGAALVFQKGLKEATFTRNTWAEGSGVYSDCMEGKRYHGDRRRDNRNMEWLILDGERLNWKSSLPEHVVSTRRFCRNDLLHNACPCTPYALCIKKNEKMKKLKKIKNKNGPIMHAPISYTQKGKSDKVPDNGGESSPKSA